MNQRTDPSVSAARFVTAGPEVGSAGPTKAPSRGGSFSGCRAGTFRALRHRSLRLYLVGQVASASGGVRLSLLVGAAAGLAAATLGTWVHTPSHPDDALTGLPQMASHPAEHRSEARPEAPDHSGAPAGPDTPGLSNQRGDAA